MKWLIEMLGKVLTFSYKLSSMTALCLYTTCFIVLFYNSNFSFSGTSAVLAVFLGLAGMIRAVSGTSGRGFALGNSARLPSSHSGTTASTICLKRQLACTSTGQAFSSVWKGMQRTATRRSSKCWVTAGTMRLRRRSTHLVCSSLDWQVCCF